MKKYLAITAALALVLTACGHAAPDSTPTLTAATETTQATAAPAEPPQGIGSGALRMLTAAADGVYYQAFNDWEINYTDTMGRALVYAIDEQTGDARPVCSLPGCAHDSAACPAWSDGNVTLCYGNGDEVYLLLFYYNDETSYYRWERISADHTQRTVLATIEPGQSVVGRGVAVDDVNLYYSLLDEDNRHQTLWAVDKTGGQAQKICTWDDLPDGTGEYAPEMYTLLEVGGQQMTFAKMIQSNDALTKAMQICTVDLANGSCTPQQRYERDAGTVFVTGDGMEKRDLISYRNDYQILTEGSRSGLANCNYQSGEVGFVDAAVDTLTPVADGFPTTRDGWECYYSLSGFADGWLVWVDEGVSFVMADIPGIIEGASEGIGLGHDFLRHVERCRLLLHVVDVSGSECRDPIEDFEKINEELAKFSPALAERPQIVVGNKCDLATEEQIDTFRRYVEEKGLTFVPISAATMQGVRELPGLVYNRLKDIPAIPVFTPEYKKPEAKAGSREFTIKRMEAHVWSVDAPWLEYILAGSNVDDYESLQYFQRQLGESGILDALVQKGVQENDTILIGEYQFDYIF